MMVPQKTTVKIQSRGSEVGRHGKVWDDRPHSTVRRIVIQQEGYICSIHVEYDDNGESIWGFKHGTDVGSTSKVDLDHPNEYLISMYCYYDKLFIRSLTLHTNRKTCGPYGIEMGTKFSFPIMGAKIVGFHGCCDNKALTAIGVYIQPIPKMLINNFSLPPSASRGKPKHKDGDPPSTTTQTNTL